MDAEEIGIVLRLAERGGHWRVAPCDAITGEGLGAALDWLLLGPASLRVAGEPSDKSKAKAAADEGAAAVTVPERGRDDDGGFEPDVPLALQAFLAVAAAAEEKLARDDDDDEGD